MLVVDFVLSRFVSEDSMDDGGINEMLFRKGRFGIFCYSFGCIHLRGVIVSRSHPACVRTVLDEYLVRAYSCQIFKTLASNRWVFLSSYGLGYVYIQTGTIWAPILCHFLIDFISGMLIRFRRKRNMNELSRMPTSEPK